MKRCIFSFFLIVILSGCTTYHGLKPLKPGIVGETTKSYPTFEWKASEKENVKYDIIVYDMVMRHNVPMGGKTVYYREGLGECKHTLEEDLEKGKDYLWSVRVRDGNHVGPWSRYDFSGYFVFAYVRQRNHLFQLEVIDPKASKKSDW